MFHGKDIIILTEFFHLNYNGKHLSNKESSIRIHKFLGIKESAYSETHKSVWNMDNLETEGRSLMRIKQIFRIIYDKIDSLICQDNLNFHLQDVNMQETSLFKTFKENITNRN